jgi:hypothetical protein
LKSKNETNSASRHSLDVGGHSQQQQQQQVHLQQQQQHSNVENRNLHFVQNQQSSYNVNMAYQPRQRDGPRAFASMSQLDVLSPRNRRSNDEAIEAKMVGKHLNIILAFENDQEQCMDLELFL